MYLVLIETAGNQNFIFSTNKLKENIGASELTYRAGTKWVLEAVGEINGSNNLMLWKDSEILRKNLLNSTLNPPIDTPNVKIEVIIATSGKALLLTQNPEYAKTIIQEVTKQALCKAPGLDICGVFLEFKWDEKESVAEDKPQSLAEAIREIYKKIESVRSRRPSPNLRFLQLPVIDKCSTSGLPASQLESTSDRKPISAVSEAKGQYNPSGFERIESILKKKFPKINFFRSVKALDEEYNQEEDRESSTNKSIQEESTRKIEWLAIIHADGNGLGEIFLKFDRYINSIESTDFNINRNYANALRKFSIALDICTENAFFSAIGSLISKDSSSVPIVPLILGGDDLTIICDGKIALQFTQKFLKAFEEETASEENTEGILKKIAKEAFTIERLSACAGIAIVKPHFPSSIAYDLAEKLTKSAKQVKDLVKISKNDKPYPCSALDFHIVYDSSGVELNYIRKKLEFDDGKILLYSRPYVVTDETRLQAATPKSLEWVKLHRWESLEERVRVLTATGEDGRRTLPNSQIHDLRSGLFLGKDLADARYRLIRDRYLKQNIHLLEGDRQKQSLFVQEPVSGKWITGLLDAIDAANFLDIQ